MVHLFSFMLSRAGGFGEGAEAVGRGPVSFLGDDVAATPSSRRRVDGVEVNAAIQDERAVNLISTQVDAVHDQDVVVLAADVDEGREDDEVDGELAVEVDADGRDVPAVGPAGEELGLPAFSYAS